MPTKNREQFLTIKRINIEDVTRVTGLSRSTVDRVINARGGVRPDTQKRVKKALKTLGYAPSALLSRQLNPGASLCVVLPGGANPLFPEIHKGITAAIAPLVAAGVPIDFREFDPYRADTLVKILQKIPDETTAVIVVGAESLGIETAINDVVARGIRVVTLASDIPNSSRHAFVGQDNFVAGQTAGRLILETQRASAGDIAILVEDLKFRQFLDRQSGFQQVLGLERSELRLLTPKPHGQSKSGVNAVVDQLAQNRDTLAAVYITGNGHPHLLDALDALKTPTLVMISHDLTDASKALLRARLLNFVVACDVYEMGRKAVEFALGEGVHANYNCAITIHVSDNAQAT